MTSLLDTKIPIARNRLEGITATRSEIESEILRLLGIRPMTPTELASKFNQTREAFSRNYLYPMRDAKKISKVDGSNYFKLPKQKSNTLTIKENLKSQYEIFQTELFKNWIKHNHSKREPIRHVRFAKLCLGLVNPKFQIHPDNITKENWKEIIPNMVDALLEIAEYQIVNNEPDYNNRQTIRHALIYGLGITIPEEIGTQLRISGTKPKPKISDLHITEEQITNAKILLKKKNVDPIWFLKFGVKTWTFMRPSTLYLIELKNMEFLNQTIEFVLGKDDKKITNEKVIEYAKFRGEKILSFTRRICHMKVFENKTNADYDKYILDFEFVEPLEKFYRKRLSQKKKYLFWEDNNTKFVFETYDTVVYPKVAKDNDFFKNLFLKIGFNASDFGMCFRANYGFRHFGIQMWLIYTDYDYDLVSEMSHEDTTTLKKWYGKRTQENFQNKITSVV